MDTLIPSPSGPSTRTLLALDVDGVPNRLNDGYGPKTVLVRTQHGSKFPINFDPEIIEALDTVVHDCNIELGWTTTWGPNVHALITQAFDGLLSGGFVLVKEPPLYRGKRPRHWKWAGIQARVKVTGQPFVWVDDDEIDLTRYTADFDEGRGLGVPNLLIATRPVVGITLAEIEAIRVFATKNNENR